MKTRPRRGIVLVLVLVVITLLTLSALTLSELMVAERRAAQLTGQQAQARALAESGVEMARHFLDSDPDTQNQAGGWYDNAQQFCGRRGPGRRRSRSDRGRFSILAPRVDDTSGHAGPLRAERRVRADQPGDGPGARQDTPGTGEQILMALPGMTQVDRRRHPRLDRRRTTTRARTAPRASTTARSTLPTRRGTASPDTIEELPAGARRYAAAPLRPGQQPQRRAGRRRARQRQPREGVDNSDGSMNCGWAAYLTLYSAESNLQSDGTPKINLNQDDLQKLHDALAQALDGPSADFICAYRQLRRTAARSPPRGHRSDQERLDATPPPCWTWSACR